MKIQYCSDLHLEFPENRRLLTRNPLRPVGDILVLAGDVVTFHDFERAHEFFDFVCDHYSAVYWLPGNHEYYGSDITDKPNPLCERIRENFYLVNNHAVIHDNVTLVFSTLWSRISPHYEWDIQRSISDFSAIRYKGGKFTAHCFSLLHEDSLNFLIKALYKEKEGPTVVITHHVPSLMNYPQVYKNSLLTEAFAVELFDLITNAGADCWIYGHHHVNTPEFNIGRTRMLTNQLGYVRQYEHKSFRRGATIIPGK
ncbi:MAG: metallophosphoesterase [Chitinophagaceae bacterium]|nr:metallophosphoesterase [Chitinophagaceae bacterium]